MIVCKGRSSQKKVAFIRNDKSETEAVRHSIMHVVFGWSVDVK